MPEDGDEYEDSATKSDRSVPPISGDVSAMPLVSHSSLAGMFANRNGTLSAWNVLIEKRCIGVFDTQ